MSLSWISMSAKKIVRLEDRLEELEKVKKDIKEGQRRVKVEIDIGEYINFRIKVWHL